jgi:hypothetical protein
MYFPTVYNLQREECGHFPLLHPFIILVKWIRNLHTFSNLFSKMTELSGKRSKYHFSLSYILWTLQKKKSHKNQFKKMEASSWCRESVTKTFIKSNF